MTPDELRARCLALPGAVEEFPFGAGVSVFEVRGKVFALSALGAEPLRVSTKCHPGLAESLRMSYAAIAPGYHLNKRPWITTTLGGDAPDELVRDLVEDSHDLARPRARPRAGG